MKRRLLQSLMAMVLVLAPLNAARAQVFYSMPGARPARDDSPILGLTVGLGEDLFRLVGFGRFNASRSADIGLEITYEDLDTGPGSNDQSRFGGGADFKALVVRQGDNTPVDAAVQLGAGVLARSNYTLIKVPVGALVSRSFALDDNRSTVPYAGVYVVMDFLDIDSRGANSGFNSDVDVELRAGASVDLVDNATFYAAFHVGNGTLFFLGFAASL